MVEHEKLFYKYKALENLHVNVNKIEQTKSHDDLRILLVKFLRGSSGREP